MAPAGRRRGTQPGAPTEAGAAAAVAGGAGAAVKAAAAALGPPSSESAGRGTGLPLKDLGKLVVGKVLRRPSASVRTPYVADVQLASGEQVLAHTPALDCAGLIVPGASVRMTANAPRKDGAQPTKTTHAIQLAEEPREDGSVALVGAHPALAEAFADEALQRRLIPELGPYTRVLRQQTFGSARVDYVLEREGGGLLLLEVKNVVCADYPEGGVPEGRSKVGVYTSAAAPYTRTALFPHGAQKKAIGVVSDRAIKHLHELTLMQQEGRVVLPPRVAKVLGGGEEGAAVPVQTAVMFVVNRSDCAAFRPCHEACPMLARMLRRAEAAGVAVLAYAIDWQGGAAWWGRRLPVVYGAGVRAEDVDDAHLARVLEFNATDPRTHWKSAGRSPAKKSKAQVKAEPDGEGEPGGQAEAEQKGEEQGPAQGARPGPGPAQAAAEAPLIKGARVRRAAAKKAPAAEKKGPASPKRSRAARPAAEEAGGQEAAELAPGPRPTKRPRGPGRGKQAAGEDEAGAGGSGSGCGDREGCVAPARGSRAGRNRGAGKGE